MTEHPTLLEAATRRLDRAVTDNFGEDTVEVKREDIRSLLSALYRETKAHDQSTRMMIHQATARRVQDPTAWDEAHVLRFREHLSASWFERLGFDALSDHLTAEQTLTWQTLSLAVRNHLESALYVTYDVDDDEADQDAISDILYVMTDDTLKSLEGTR